MLEQHLPADDPALVPGPLVTTTGEVVGAHDGFARYTIGQRKRLPGGFDGPRYVVAIRPDAREVVIGGLEDLDGHRVALEEINWLGEPLMAGESCRVQLRYRAPDVPATVVDSANGELELVLETPVRAITPGQSGVIYDSAGRVLGGGVIAQVPQLRSVR